ncbi:Cupin domain-containing protein [Cnuella takakiae]|uniref:Cupin domain-containing protein n=1 Tax=Cnuella takakiae TaxID=1302690 RepID=A0A1M4YYU1_9BACT|nr:cupin domain-containing protein [Cnuella takakiae]OLY94381.1 cupin [Cnuella takakiae]SHF10973.1 Cupin domain-containing protein [Cnuella takakiae]
MKRVLSLLLTITGLHAFSQTLSTRVVHNDPAKYRQLSAVHAGAGQMKFAGLLGSQALTTNLLYLHAGEIPDKAGIGQHFHHTIEELYVIFDGEAEFTVNGRTSKIKGPAVVPCKMGSAHGIYNSSGKTLRWLNFAVSTTKGRGDNFDLGDDRVGAALDPIPQFVSGQLKREALRTGTTPYAGNGIQYRRILGPDVFATSWDHVDHLVIPAGSNAGRQLEGLETVYYVLKGSGTVAINTDAAPVKTDDAFYGAAGEAVKITNDGKEDLELLAIGIATAKQKEPARAKAAAQPKAMVLQMDFVVAKENAAAFEQMYTNVYVPAMMVQQGYVESKLLRLFPEQLEKEIEGEATTYNYQLQLSFDTEENRRKWVASEQHKAAWPAAARLAKSYKWRGYEVAGDNRR